MSKKSGRGNPPKEFQFKKGVSGNLKGRPPKSRKDQLVIDIISEFRNILAAYHEGPTRTHEKAKSVQLTLANRLARQRLILPVRLHPNRKFPGMNEPSNRLQLSLQPNLSAPQTE